MTALLRLFFLSVSEKTSEVSDCSLAPEWICSVSLKLAGVTVHVSEYC